MTHTSSIYPLFSRADQRTRINESTCRSSCCFQQRGGDQWYKEADAKGVVLNSITYNRQKKEHPARFSPSIDHRRQSKEALKNHMAGAMLLAARLQRSRKIEDMNSQPRSVASNGKSSKLLMSLLPVLCGGETGCRPPNWMDQLVLLASRGKLQTAGGVYLCTSWCSWYYPSMVHISVVSTSSSNRLIYF